MKFIYQTLLALGLAASVAHGGEFVTGQALTFTASDFATVNTATLTYSITSQSSASDTDVYAQQNMFLGTDGRVSTEFPGNQLEEFLTYEATTPGSNPITNFTFALNDITYAGTPGSTYTINYQYSTDGTNWTTFNTVDNRDASVTTPYDTLSNQVFNVALPDATNTLFIRLDQVETNADTGYFAVFSNDSTGNGGTSPNSYISVTVESPTVVPEPSTFVLLGAGGCLLFFVIRQRRSQKNLGA